MSYGLGIYTTYGTDVLGSTPLRYTVLNAPMVWRGSPVPPTAGTWYSWCVQIPAITSHTIISVYPPKNKGANKAFGVGWEIAYSNGTYWVLASFNTYGFNVPERYSTAFDYAEDVPRVYVADRVPPQQAATGMGIEVYDAQGKIILNSSTPLVEVLDITSVEINGDGIIGPHQDSLLFLNNFSGSGMAATKFINYPGIGGGNITPLFGGWDFSISWEGGMYSAHSWEWEQEMGEGEDWYPVRHNLIITRVKKPKV